MAEPLHKFSEDERHHVVRAPWHRAGCSRAGVSGSAAADGHRGVRA